ncbi:glycosyltransferase [Candidatus Chloroploca sp. M-50]|uniref:Glycosyltransferase n=1 Tax=Candidatus Chloroploca mongolica TaxID=2528176 RepID=A0ABS4D9L0_9CHLR|nr:glycosyltransferase [Candidatus Chloroploca mongolica]MBP1466126.1 glycosyltransferase [Candidatus Chloroploca mongolica]
MNQSSLSSSPPVDIIVPTRGRGELITTTIASIRTLRDVHFTLWVIDQSDDDRTEQCVRRHALEDPRICYRRTPTVGASTARNLGVSLGQAPFILFTDDDCYVHPAWASSMLAELRKPSIWAVFGRVLPATHGGENATVLRGGTVAIKPVQEAQVYRGNRLDLSFGHGASMGVRRERMVQLGGFDELLGAGGPLHSWEDRDVGYRILAAGGQIAYTPAAVIYHRQWRDWDAIRRVFRGYAIGAGASASKYVRCGDPVGVAIFTEWMFSQGLRQAFSAILKWRSWPKLQVALEQFVYPWYGFVQGFRYPVDRTHCLYRTGVQPTEVVQAH